MEHDDTTEDADFAAGFAETAAATAEQPAAPAGGATPEGAEDANAAPANAAAAQAPAADDKGNAAATTDDPPAVDPFAGLPKEVRDLLAEIPTLRTRTETAERKAMEFGGRVASLQSKFDRMTASPAAAPAPAAPAVNPKVQALRDQGLDEIADAIEAVAPKPQQEPPPAPAPTRTAQAAPPAMDESPEFKTLTKLRPNWADEVSGSDYVLWLNRQPAAYRQQVETSSDPADVLLSLQDFDKHRGSTATPPPPPPPPSNTRQTRLAAGLTPQGDGKRAARGAQTTDEDAEFEAGFHGRP